MIGTIGRNRAGNRINVPDDDCVRREILSAFRMVGTVRGIAISSYIASSGAWIRSSIVDSVFVAIVGLPSCYRQYTRLPKHYAPFFLPYKGLCLVVPKCRLTLRAPVAIVNGTVGRETPHRTLD